MAEHLRYGRCAASDSKTDCNPDGKRQTRVDVSCADCGNHWQQRTPVYTSGQQEQNKNIWVPVGE